MGVEQAIDITSSQRKIVLALIQQYLPGVAVWAYGSRVKWTSRPQSDLDLVAFASPEQKDQVGDLREAFEESDLPFRVDLFVWDEVPESFKEQIEAEYVELAERGNISNRWKNLPLNALTDIRFSNVDKKIDQSEVDVCLCNYKDVYYNNFICSDMEFMKATATEREIKKCALCKDDVVITKDSEKYDDIGVPALVRENIKGLVCGYHLAIIRPLEQIYGPYLFYALSALPAQKQFHSYANGVTRFGLRKADIGAVELPVPSHSEQRAIAHILSTLDDKIELNRRMNETLEEIARALFKSWFVDFDPVRAKMKNRDTGLPKHIADLFPDRLMESELGHIPEGWEIKPLDKIAQFLNGLALQKFPALDHQNSLPVIKIAELRNGISARTDRASHAVPSQYIVKDGDFLFSWSGSLLAKFWSGGNGALNQHLFKVTSSQYPAWFFSQWIYFHLREFRGIASAKATTMGHIQRGHLAAAITTCAPDSAIKGLGEIFVPLVDRMLKNDLESRTLKILRDILLPRLIFGDISTKSLSYSSLVDSA